MRQARERRIPLAHLCISGSGITTRSSSPMPRRRVGNCVRGLLGHLYGRRAKSTRRWSTNELSTTNARKSTKGVQVARVKCQTNSMMQVPGGGMLNAEISDPGGQQNKRRKWIHLFDNQTGVMFVVSLAGYRLKGDSGSKPGDLQLVFYLVPSLREARGEQAGQGD